ncbi:MAG TPA: carboxypeptidase-like regulatory domain-containing protein [Candidatus Sulfotelmatobacter sp.]|nr:carboxypeptidase-like regulatory domain-containing protein [Candidatus Sulfotelmatobacter sp.]
MAFDRKAHGLGIHLRRFLALSLGILCCSSLALAQNQQPESAPPAESGGTPQQSSASISGTVVDSSGGVVAGARAKLTYGDPPASQELLTDSDGHFSFANVPPGLFQLTITAEGFATQTVTGIVRAGESNSVPQVTLAVATAVTEVRVGATQVEIAEAEIKQEEQQRVLGFIPNFYVSYVPNAAPLVPKQKFELAWKTYIDPVTLVLTAGSAGLQQAQNSFGGYGQGAQGYGKRLGASYGDLLTGTFFSGAVFPALLKQDPRYFYKGTGSFRSRLFYAVANAVICKGDNGRWQLNYSGILGSLASGAVSNAYYPPNDRGASLLFEGEAMGIGTAAVANIFQEFVVKKFTPSASHHDPSKP